MRIVGDETLPVRRVALCSGSGGGLLKTVFASGAQVYVSGDLRYHDARDAQAAGLGLIDIGHFAGEHLVLEPLSEKLAEALRQAGWGRCGDVLRYGAGSFPDPGGLNFDGSVKTQNLRYANPSSFQRTSKYASFFRVRKP